MYKTEIVVSSLIFLNKKSDFSEAGIDMDDEIASDIDDDKF